MAPVAVFPLNVGHIDDVQELKKAKLTSIPERFVREIAERPALATPTQSSSPGNVPVIDLSKLLEDNKNDFHSEILKLTASCEEWGFFQVHALSTRAHTHIYLC